MNGASVYAELCVLSWSTIRCLVYVVVMCVELCVRSSVGPLCVPVLVSKHLFHSATLTSMLYVFVSIMRRWVGLSRRLRVMTGGRLGCLCYVARLGR